MLAIDDEEDALTLLRVVLEAAGAEVTTLAIAARPRWSASSEPIHDVLVVDLGMPEMDGFELIARIRASPDPHIRESAGRGADRLRALGGSHQGAASGFEMHLAKPVDPGELVASVATLFRRSHTAS